jgi:hypothetical protein
MAEQGPAPETPARGRLRWPVALAGQFLLVFGVVALSSPGRIDIVDGQTRYAVAHSLVEHGDSIVRDRRATFRVHTGRDGEKYTPYRFPQSGLGVLAILAADATGPVSEPRRHFFFTLISPFFCALLAVTYSVWFRGMGLSPKASLGWATAGVFCTPSWYYGTSTFDDMLGTFAVVLAAATAYLGRDRRPWLGAVVAGLALGWAVNCKEPLAVFVLPVLAAGYRVSVPARQQWGPAAVVVGGLLLGAISYLAYERYKFPPGSPDHNAEYEKDYGPMWTRDPLPALAGFAMSPSAGVIWYCPTILLSLAGWAVWHRDCGWYCQAVAGASLLFIGFLSFLTFFKGEPCWGPRYLTPVFALWWAFVPAARERLGSLLIKLLLMLGFLVQLLALAVDPQRLMLQKEIPYDYYIHDPWLQFHPQASHLLQRPREIREILSRKDRAPRYSPAHLPTYDARIPPVFPQAMTGALGHASSPLLPRSVAAVGALFWSGDAHHKIEFKGAVTRYHIFNSLRPWWIGQQYLDPEDRPVHLEQTVALLLGLVGLGLGLMVLGGRASS